MDISDIQITKDINGKERIIKGINMADNELFKSFDEQSKSFVRQ